MKCFIAILLVALCCSAVVSAKQQPIRPVDGIDPSVIVNIAKDIWNLIEANKPVVDIETDFANGYPSGVNNSMELENWVIPPMTVPGGRVVDLVGHARAVVFNWTLEFTYGGDYNGIGKYLDDITISPTTVDVIDFFDFSVVTHIGKPINVGNSTHPIAGVQVDMEWKITGPIHTDEGAITYFVQGDGKWECVNDCGN